MKAQLTICCKVCVVLLLLSTNNLFSQIIAQRMTTDFTITSSLYDYGSYQDLLDGNTYTQWRSAGVNPAFIQFEFEVPVKIDSISVFIGQMGAQPYFDSEIWQLETADNLTDLSGKSGSYRLVIDKSKDTVAGIWQSFRLNQANVKKIWKFTIQRTVGGNNVHVPEIGLYRLIDKKDLIVKYPIQLEKDAGNLMMDFSGWRPGYKAVDGDKNTYYDFDGDNNGWILFAFNQKKTFTGIRTYLKDTCSWWVEGADSYADLENKGTSFCQSAISKSDKIDKWDTVSFSGTISKKVYRLCYTNSGGKLKIAEIEYLTNVPPDSIYGILDDIELWEGWQWKNTPELLLFDGKDLFEKKNAQWISSDTSVATIDTNGTITAKKAGNTIIKALYSGASHVTKLKVIAPVKQMERQELTKFLSAPADNCVYEMPVLVIHYIPTTDGLTKDPNYSPDLYSMDKKPLKDIRDRVLTYIERFKLALEEGSKFRKYKNPAARSSIGVKIVDYITVYEPCPPSIQNCGYSAGMLFYAIDFKQIFERLNIKDYIENKNVKQIWFWASGLDAGMSAFNPDVHRPENFRSSFEAFMSTPTEFQIANGCHPEGLPVYNKTYTVICGDYSYPEFVPQNFEPFTHQFEWLIKYQNWLQEGRGICGYWDWNGTDKDFFERKFSGYIGRCGWTHMPPNTTINYGYFHYIQEDTNLVKPVWCDIEDWKPDSSGEKTLISYHTWEDKVYNWPDSVKDFEGRRELQWFIYWLQSIPGYENNIPYLKNDTLFGMSNWWRFFYDWDTYTKSGNVGLWELKPDVSVKEESENGIITIYPNPVENSLMLKFSGKSESEEVRIVNMIGQVMWEGNLINGINKIDVGHLPTGIYFINTDSFVKCFVKD